MMGANDIFKSTLGDLPEGDVQFNSVAARALIKAGLAVLLIQPNGKKPVCTLGAEAAKRADNAAQREAKAAGNTNWASVRHQCGRHHVMTSVKELAKPRVKELLAAGANIAVVPGAGETPIIVVDLDTREQRRGFCEEWTAAIGEEVLEPMTVSSPGVMRTEVGGEEIWDHKDGGHYWFTIPEGRTIPAHIQKYVGATDWTVYVRDCYVLVPPSVREEGPYRLTGAALEAPEWLLDRLESVEVPQSSERLKERLAAGPDGADDIDQWSSRTSWEEILSARGWTGTGHHDGCGCPTWTRPGSPVHAKSATAHEPGCSQYDTSTGHAPLHAWSDAVVAMLGGRSTVSKLTFLAIVDHNGDQAAAMREIGVDPESATDLPDLEYLDPWAGEVDSPKGEAGEDSAVDDSWKPVDLADYVNGTYRPPAPTLFPRSDTDSETGESRCLLYPGKLHSFHGESESGKSLVLMWEAVRLMKAGQDVLWITFDSDAQEDVARALRMGCPPDVLMTHMTYVKPDTPPALAAESYKALFLRPFALAVIDGVTDAVGLVLGATKGDPNEAYTEFSRRFPRRLADMTGAAVVLVDHVTKNSEERGRFAIGAQAKMSQLTGAAYLVEPGEQAPTAGGVGTVILRVGKDRPGGVRRYSGPRNPRNRTQEAAVITVDDTGTWTVMTVEPPEIPDPFGNGTGEDIVRPEELMVQISRFLESSAPEGYTATELRAATKKRAEDVRLACRILSNEGYTEITRRGKADIHGHVRRYEKDPDPIDETESDTPEDLGHEEVA